jgi:hypothetical protein
MTTKNRIEKLEDAIPAQGATDNRQLKRVIGADGNKFYIDGVQVDYEVYVKVERAQIADARARGEGGGIVVNFVPRLEGAQ